MNMTAEEIAERFGDIGLVVPIEAELWDTTADHDHAPYGYMPSALVVPTSAEEFSQARLASDGALGFERVLRVCPELIAAHTEGEDETTARWYMNSLIIHLKMHVAHVEMPIDELEDEIEHVLQMLAPDAYGAILRIRARAQ